MIKDHTAEKFFILFYLLSWNFFPISEWIVGTFYIHEKRIKIINLLHLCHAIIKVIVHKYYIVEEKSLLPVWT